MKHHYQPSHLALLISLILGGILFLLAASFSVALADPPLPAEESELPPAAPWTAPPADIRPLDHTDPAQDRCAGGEIPSFDGQPCPPAPAQPAPPAPLPPQPNVPRVGINGAGCVYETLTDAIAAATAGDSIQMAAGTYNEAVDLTNISLTIRGGYDPTCTTPEAGPSILDGTGAPQSVVDILNSAVVLRDLTITGGSGIGAGVDADEDSRVTLDNLDVTGNHTTYGGGLYVGQTAVVTVTNGTKIQNNTASVAGGGARVWGKLAGSGWTSSIGYNSAPDGGGISVPGGTVALGPTHVAYNQATAPTGRGGGIHVLDGGQVTVTASANVHHNSAHDGAGIYADDATVHLSAVVHSNVAANHGGGLYLANGSTLSALNSHIGYPTTGRGNTALLGAGIYLDGSTANLAGAVQNNVAAYSGAGIYATNSTLHLHDIQVGGTEAHQANQLGPNGNVGVGLHLANGTHATLDDAVISGNLFQTTGFTYGGGAYVASGSVLTLTGSTIADHVAPSTTDGRGAGLYLSNSSATLDNSQVLTNTAGATGGGVRLWEASTLTILNGSELRNNHAANGAGGAIAAAGTPEIHIAGTTLRSNTAATDGGAIYLDAGTLDFTGGWNLVQNTAARHGGAIAVLGTATANLRAGAYTFIYFNRAQGGHGGLLYLANNTTANLYATAGHEMTIYANHASENGGALYADNGGYFDIYGRVHFDRNRADNGGAIYLSNGSRVWLDDYVNDRPELWDNWADVGSGGAIYAVDSPRVECDGATFGRTGEGNQAAVSGGAVYLGGSSFSADNCFFVDNHAALHGGAIAAYTSDLDILATFQSPGAHLPDAPRSPITPQATGCNPAAGPCSAFSGNVADRAAAGAGDGGAIYTDDSALNVAHTHLHGNSAQRGGAIYQTGANAVGQVTNSLVHGNSVAVEFGAGIRRSGGVFTVTHVTLASNVGGSGFSGVASAAHNNIAWGNDGYPGFAAIPLDASCNIDDGGNAGPALDPLFVAPGAGGNYRLSEGSPAIDACATGLSPDLRNVPRPVGSAYDMGAYEFRIVKIYLPHLQRN